MIQLAGIWCAVDILNGRKPLYQKPKEKGEGFDKILKEELNKDGPGKELRKQD